MTTEKKVQTAVVMDVTGVERSSEQAKRAVSDMASSIAKEGEKAGRGLEGMGAGAEKAERTVDAATKSIGDRVRRLTRQAQRELAGLAAAADGGPGSASSVEYEATLRGADISKVQPQIAALRQLEQQVDSLSASMRQAMAGDEFIGGINSRITALQRQASAAKMTEADLLALRAAELGVAQQADPLIAKLRQAAAAADEVAAASKRAAAGDDFIKGLGSQANAIGKTRADLLELKAAELGVTAQAAPMIARIRQADGELVGMGKNAKMTAAALRTVPAQFTDIVVSLQAGQNPLQVLLQQGGQLKDQFGGIGPAAQAMGGYLRGLVSPVTVAAGALALIGVAAYQGAQELGALQRAVIESGGRIGVSAGQIYGMASAIDAIGAGRTGKAVEVLAQLARAGEVGAEGLQRYAQAAIQFEKAGGQAADKTVEAFNELGRSPVAAVAKLNRELNFLTPALYAQIKALEDTGRSTEAARVAQDAYADALQQRTPEMLQSLGSLERGWLAVKDATGAAWSFLQGIGRETTAGQQIAKIGAEIQKIDERFSTDRGGKLPPLVAAERARLQTQLDGLRRVEQGERLAASAGQQRAQATEAQVRVEKLREETLSKQVKMERELGKYRRDADTLNLDAEQRRKDEAAIRDKYKEKGSQNTGERGLAKALLAEQLQDVRSAEQQKLTIYRQSEQIIEALRQAGLVDEAEYYEAKRGFVALDSEAKTSAIEKELALMRAFNGTAREDAQVRKDIAVAEQKLAQARAEGAGRAIILTTQQTAAIEAQTRAMRELQIAADAELAAMLRRFGVQSQQAGMGDRRAAELAEEEALAAGFTQRQAQLDAEYRNGRLRGKEDQYRQELTLLITEEGKQLEALAEFQRKRRELDNDYRTGAKRGIENVIDDTMQTASRTARLTEDAFKGLGDALTDLFTKGKADWSSLEQTIVAGITRIIIEQQMIRPIAQFLQGGAGGVLEGFAGTVIQGLFGGGGAGTVGMPDGVPTRGGRAMGGAVERGGLYEINETRRGPGEVLNVGGRQYLMALQGGHVSPVRQESTARSGAVAQTNNFHFSGRVDRRTQQQLAATAGTAAQRALARNT
jgi:lambda family phage tail tape measure protein